MSRRGFTLVEVLVALAVAGLVLAFGFGALAVGSDLWHRAERTTGDDARAMAARTLLSSWLADARGTSDRHAAELLGVPGSSAGLPEDSLVFVTPAAPPYTDGPTRVSVFVRADSVVRDTALVAELSESAVSVPRRIELAAEVKGLRADYADPARPGSWDRSWNSGAVLPAAVRLSFYAAPGRTLPDLLRIPLVVPLWAGR